MNKQNVSSDRLIGIGFDFDIQDKKYRTINGVNLS